MRRFTIAAVLLAHAAAWAQSVDFKTVLDASLRNNKELLAKKLDVQSAQEALKLVKSDAYGTLSINENFMRTNHSGYAFSQKLASRRASFGDFGVDEFMDASQSGGVLALEPKKLNYPDAVNSFETTLEYSVPVFTGFKLSYAKEMADSMLKSSRQNLLFDEKKLSMQTLVAYNGAVAAKEYVQAAKSSKAAAQSLLSLSKEFVSSGVATKIDLLQAESYLAQTDAALSQAQADYESALAYLRFLTGLGEIGSVGEFEDAKGESKPLGQLVQTAMLSRDDLAGSESVMRAHEQKIGMEKGSYYPTLAAYAKYGFSDKNPTLSTDRDFYIVGANLSYTIFDGGKRSTQLQQAKIEAARQRLLTDQHAQSVRLEVERNKAQSEAKAQQMVQRKKQLELSEDVAQKYRLMYQNGLATMSDLLAKEALTATAKAQLISAKYEESAANAALKSAIGESIRESR